MAEGDTIHRLARRIEATLAGDELAVAAPNPRGRAAGVDRLDGMLLERATARGKHLLLDFGELVLHSHLGISGSWHLYAPGERWRRSERTAWVVLRGKRGQAAQWDGPTLRVLRAAQLRSDPRLRGLGPDILVAEPAVSASSLRMAEPGRALGEALLDQTLVAGIGNIFKSEGCFAARIDPRRPVSGLDDGELGQVVEATRLLMEGAARSGRHPRAVYRRTGQPCPACGTPISSRGQGDANRTTYWCERCQA
jgi:endonuclease VIII